MGKATIEIAISDTVTVENFVQSLATGAVKVYTVRSNGKGMRHIPFFADGTKEREEAEWVLEQREDGRTMKAIAQELHLSVPSVRRILNSLYLSEDMEAYEPEDVAALLEANTPEHVIGTVTGPADEAKATDATCQHCGDILDAGNICMEDFAKHVSNA